jgi:hypothetical protein
MLYFDSSIHKHMETIIANRVHVEAQYLSVGDKLASGGIVTHRPSVGIKTPSGKVEIGVNGFLKVWNKRTPITILK